jgi:competence protein ComEA
MKYRNIILVLLASALLGPGLLAQAHPARPTRPTKALPPAKLVDINSATRDELKTLPGITDTLAGLIIAGRPYLTKAHLVTHRILPRTVYAAVKDRVIAKQDLRKK